MMKGLKKQLEVDKAPPPVAEAPVAAKAGKTGKRAGTRMIAGHFSVEVSRRLAQIALDEDTSIQALVGEGLDAVFKARGLPLSAGR